MFRFLQCLILLLLCIAVFGSCSTETEQPNNTSSFAFAENNGGITLPTGFHAVLVADSLGRARHLVVDKDGDIYVALRYDHEGKGIAALRDTDGDGIADVTRYFGTYTGTGITLHNGYLYFGGDSAVVRYSMEGVDLVPTSEPELIISGFREQPGHQAKPITFDDQGNLYVYVGPPSNACQEHNRQVGSPGLDPCPFLEYSGGIWKFDANKTDQVHGTDGQRFATGIRNAVAMEWNRETGQLYAVQHGRDQLSQLWPDYYDAEENAELPAEEFFKVDEGDNFGWPYTYYDHLREQKMMNPEYGGDGKTPAPDGQYENPIISFPGHWAPNDLIFYTGTQFPTEYLGGAFIAFHGSWNRSPLPQQGYSVVFVPFDGANPTDASYRVFSDGFAGSQPLYDRENARHRPVGLALGADGSLYIVDSVAGKLWRIIYTGT